VCLSVFGPGHIAGTAILIAPLVLDVPLVVAPRWETARIHELIRREGVTATMVTPHYAEELLRRAAHEREELPLRSVVIGGDVIRRDLVAAGVARGWQILGGYGATEASIAMGPLDLDHPTNPVPLLDGVDLALLDDDGAPVPDGVPGEVVIRCAPTELLGFVDEEAMTEVFDSAGFVHMGDIARQTPRGLELVGRRKDIAIRGGENISLAEVDGILSTLPGARDAAVVSVAAARGGEALVACVVPEAGTDLGMSDVLAHFRDAGASPHKVPKRVVRVATIPRTELGKVIRNDLAAQVQAHDR
jgi:acyl-CoA synthetase (AMP-forming)/AMP-acid ligase II